MFEVHGVLKHRWAEVLLIIGLHTAAVFAVLQVPLGGNLSEADKAILPVAALLAVGFLVVQFLLLLGFMRTCFLDGQMRYEPWTLVKIGHHFFWRAVGLMLIIATVIIIVREAIVRCPAGLQNIVGLAGMAIMLLLIKPSLVGPAWIIVKDCAIGDAVRDIRHVKIMRHKRLMGYLLVLVGLSVINAFVPQFDKPLHHYNTLVAVAFSIPVGIIWLAACLETVRITGNIYLAETENEKLEETQAGSERAMEKE